MVAAYFPRNFGEFVISGFCREVQEDFLVVEDGTGTLSRSICKGLPFEAA
jgi:hypothetical protein